PDQRHRLAGECAAIDGPAVAVARDRGGGDSAGLAAHPCPLLAGDLCSIREGIDDRRVEPLFEQRQQLGSNSVPRNADIVVRLVVNERKAAPGEIPAELLTAAV